jgi:hypothetical protein
MALSLRRGVESRRLGHRDVTREAHSTSRLPSRFLGWTKTVHRPGQMGQAASVDTPAPLSTFSACPP